MLPLYLSQMFVVVMSKSCLSLCDLMESSPPGSPVHGISQARILEWVAFPSPGGLPNPGIKPIALAGGFFATEPPGSQFCFVLFLNMLTFNSIHREREREK